MKEALFINVHRTEDVAKLALRYAGTDDLDLRYCLEQIASWQKARTKLPRWAATEGLVFPPRLAMEQCSGEAASEYKRLLVRHLLPSGEATSLCDLTGGFGVDFSALAPLFTEATYVERQERLCYIARHNLPLLGLPQAKVVCDEAENILKELPPQTLIFLDPARRDSHGGKVVDLDDCEPRLPELLPLLEEKAQIIVAKLSPMLDWHRSLEQLRHVSELHIVSTGGECKELLVVMEPQKDAVAPTLYAYDDRYGTEAFDLSKASSAQLAPCGEPASGEYLYEPNPSLMKAGLFAELSVRYGLRQVARNSHLFLSEKLIADFPGRCFRIDAVSSMNRKELRKALAGTSQANIAVRNFPLSAEALRKKLKLRDGGDSYLFATTTEAVRHVLILCKKEK